MSLTNLQIDQYYKNNPLYGGCFDKNVVSRPPLSTLGPQGKFYILNMAAETGKFKNPGGTHWFLVFDCPPYPQCVYFESYGLPPPPEVKAFCDLSAKPCVSSSITLEPIDSNKCGEFCIIVANKLLAGIPLEKILTFYFDPKSPKINNELVSRFKLKDPHDRVVASHLHRLSQTIEGQGFLERLKNHSWVPDFIKKRIHVKPRDTEPDRFKKLVEEQGNSKIKSMTLGQEPVIKPVQSFLNLISFGKYDSIKKKLGYDDVYHEYMNVQLENGKTFRVEKNAVAEIKQVESPKSGNGKKIEIPIKNKDLSLSKFVKDASDQDEDFWKYNAKDNNCQHWQMKLIERNGLTPDDPKTLKEIEPQDSHKLLSSLPGPLKHLPKLATDIAGTADRWIHGNGLTHFRWVQPQCLLSNPPQFPPGYWVDDKGNRIDPALMHGEGFHGNISVNFGNPLNVKAQGPPGFEGIL